MGDVMIPWYLPVVKEAILYLLNNDIPSIQNSNTKL